MIGYLDDKSHPPEEPASLRPKINLCMLSADQTTVMISHAYSAKSLFGFRSWIIIEETSLKQKYCHFDENFITGYPASDEKFHQNNKISILMMNHQKNGK